MRRLAPAAVAAVIAIGIAVPLSIGSSHREAPLSSLDPTADDTDVYAYTAKDATDQLTVVANWIPFEDPAGGPNFYRFDDRARYYINVDNTGDGKADVKYRFKFRTKFRNEESFLYAVPKVTSIDDPDLNVVQTYSVERLRYSNGWVRDSRARSSRKHHSKRHHHSKSRSKSRSHRKLRSVDTIARNIPVAPNYTGPKTFGTPAEYDAVANQAITQLPNGGKVFAGPRDDPFFVDLGATFDSINFRRAGTTGAEGGGKDDLAGYGVHSIVLQVPEEKVTKNGQDVDSPSDSNAVVGVWASTERPRFQVLSSGNRLRNYGGDDDSGDYTQVSRLGNPLVNEVIIPLGKKDMFNRTTPDRDAELYGKYVVNPELARVMNALFPGVVNAPETDRTDIVQAVLQGLPGLNQQTGKPVDTIKVNLGTPPAASPNRLGVLAGDTAGYPNGRRLTDDVVDIDLRVVAGILKGNNIKLGDGVDQNDKSFLSSFPYLAPPTSGFDSSLKRTEGTHPAE
jgi:hypothetical protein